MFSPAFWPSFCPACPCLYQRTFSQYRAKSLTLVFLLMRFKRLLALACRSSVERETCQKQQTLIIALCLFSRVRVSTDRANVAGPIPFLPNLV